MESGSFQTASGTEVSNPLIQLARTKQKMSSMLRELGFDSHQIKAYVVFINPSFYLYNATIEDPIIFPTQLEEHLRKINQKSKKLTRADVTLAEKLCSIHEDNSFKKENPEYSLEKLRKGLICSNCEKLEYEKEGKFYKCNQCFEKVSASEVVLEQIEELKLLFPNQQLTVSFLKNWCNEAVSSYKIRDIMKTNLKMTYVGKQTYYS